MELEPKGRQPIPLKNKGNKIMIRPYILIQKEEDEDEEFEEEM